MPSIDAATWQWGKMPQLGRAGSFLGAAMDAGFRRNGVGNSLLSERAGYL